jgi:hypothetical protein
MHLVFDLISSHPLVGGLQVALTIWMLIDAQRRGADYFWFWIILLFFPIGPWLYFFAVKIGDFRGTGGWPAFQRRPSVDELHYRAEKVPTLANHLTLAQRLIEQHDIEQALPHLQAALAMEPDHCQVLFGLAQCADEQGQPQAAIPYLERIVERDRRWSDYAAMRSLIRARTQAGNDAGALEAARELVRLSPTLEHQCLLAEQLIAKGLTDEAWQSLEQSLESHRYAPGPSRRRNRPWARQARRLQKQIASR